MKLLQKKKSNEKITKEKKHMETQLLEIQGNLVEVQNQFQKAQEITRLWWNHDKLG